jgi:hypothetical protein
MAGTLPVPYDPTANQATLTDQPDGWYLWLARPDAAPAELHLFTRNEVGDAILDVNLSDQMKVIAYFEGVLAGVGYAATPEVPPMAGFLASWMLAPGQN